MLFVPSFQWAKSICCSHGNDDEPGYLLFVELNCENLFDCQHDSLKDDTAFLPDGSNLWTHGRYWKKINHLAQEILSCGDSPEHRSVVPDLVALCEVENDTVLRDLTQRSLLRNAGYQYFITNSPDQRGIDVALAYNPAFFAPIDSYSLRVTPVRNMRPTRDILYVKGVTYADTLHIFVVHAPSRAGGEIQTRPNRMAVAERLVESVDSLYAVHANPKIIVAGDFNDYITDPSIAFLERNRLVDVSAKAKGSNGAEGTYKFRGEWGSLDHILVSPTVAQRVRSCRINDAEFLLCEDERNGGRQPYRTYTGIVWHPGFSDHLPLVMTIDKP